MLPSLVLGNNFCFTSTRTTRGTVGNTKGNFRYNVRLIDRDGKRYCNFLLITPVEFALNNTFVSHLYSTNVQHFCRKSYSDLSVPVIRLVCSLEMVFVLLIH